MNLSFGSLVGSMLVSGAGLVFFNYGRKKKLPLFLVFGLVMMVYPYFVPDFLAMIAIAAALSAILYWLSKR